MDIEVLEQLELEQEAFLEIWRRKMDQGGYFKHTVAKREDSLLAFRGVLAAIRQLVTQQTAPTFEDIVQNGEKLGHFMLQEARRHRARGTTFALFTGCFKTLIQSVEELVAGLAIPEDQKTGNLLNLRKASDILETLVLADWEKSDPDQARQRLEETNRRLAVEKNTYENIFEATTDLVLLTDAEGRVIRSNPAATLFFSGQPLLGEFIGRVLGLPGRDLPELQSRITPFLNHETTIPRGDFSQVFNLRMIPLSEIALASQGVMLLLSDITCMVDHRQALESRVAERTQALANSEKMLRTIFQSVGKGILVIDGELEILKANQQASEIYGRPLENLCGLDIRSLTDAAGSRKLKDFLDALVEGQNLSAEIKGCYVDGRTFPSHINATRIDISGKKFWPIIVRDITDQKALEDRLRQEKHQSEEMNVTLRNVLNCIEGDRQEFEQNLASRIRTSLLPALERLRDENDRGVRSSYLELIRDQMISLTAGLGSELDPGLLKLSKTELKVCNFIKAGCSSKEISEAMNLAIDTVQTHRKNIRNKLGLKGADVNLHAYLAGRNCEPG